MSPAATISLLGVEVLVYLLLAVALSVFLLIFALASGMDAMGHVRIISLFRCLRCNGFKATWRLARRRRASRAGHADSQSQRVYTEERL